MRKLYEIGDQPLPIASIEHDDDDDFIYHFTVPLTQPEEDWEDQDHIEMIVVFAQKTQKVRSPTDEVIRKGEPDAQRLYHTWEMLKSKVEDDWDTRAPAFDLHKWEVLFRPVEGDWDMVGFKDRSLAIKIMATVKYCVTDFITKHSDRIHAMSFTAEKSDHGRVILYSRFIQMIGKSLNFKSIEKDFGHFIEYITFDPTMVEKLVLKLKRAEILLQDREKLLQDTESNDDEIAKINSTINDFIEDVDSGEVEIEGPPL